jgi:hypothetical protein|tara:strand:+ start:14838 stop:15677 length:840 start_codon:yes stop_codon:yes gene_type:complete
MINLLSIDIGIKNLAYCIKQFDTTTGCFKIIKWDIINLCSVIPNCYKCKKNAKFTKNNIYYCNQHVKNSDFLICDYTDKSLKKENLTSLFKIAEKYNIKYDKPINKSHLIELINNYIQIEYLNRIETINANNINLIDIGINIKERFYDIFIDINSNNYIDLTTIDNILLENQISPIASRMKTIQGMIAQYFINNGNYNILFISSQNKLKPFCQNKKTTYNERKKISIDVTKSILELNNLNDDLDYFIKHKKQDDLADCLLQGLSYIILNNKYNIKFKIQ